MRIRKQFPLFALLSLLLVGLVQGVAFAQTALPTITPIPDHVVYRLLFRRAAAFTEQAKKQDAEGKNGDPLRSLIKRNVKMNDSEFQVFGEVVAEHEQEIKKIDARAKAVIDAYRAQYPGGVVPRGEKPPSVPAELKLLQQEKNAITIRAVERLKANLNNETVSRLDNYAWKSLTQNSIPLSTPPESLSLIPTTAASLGGHR